MKLILIALLAASLSQFPGSAAASTTAGVDFNDQVVAGDTTLILRGAALLRYKLVFKAYAAALYVAEDFEPDSVLDREPLQLEIAYFWPIPAEKFAEATVDGISKNVDFETFSGLEAKITQFNEMYRDVEPDDRYTLTYVPGLGTTLALNGEELGRIDGDDFAAALFSIWLGDVPFDRDLKASLLEVSL